MKLILCILTLMVAITSVQADPKKPFPIQWKPVDCSSPLMLPEQNYAVSQFGKGKYRIDSFLVSRGHFNCIYIIFQAEKTLDPASVKDAVESTFTVKTEKVVWRRYKTVVEGRSVIRKEALMPNILPHEGKGDSSNYIWLRIDADSQEILDQLTAVAEGVIQDAVSEAADKGP